MTYKIFPEQKLSQGKKPSVGINIFNWNLSYGFEYKKTA